MFLSTSNWVCCSGIMLPRSMEPEESWKSNNSSAWYRRRKSTSLSSKTQSPLTSPVSLAVRQVAHGGGDAHTVFLLVLTRASLRLLPPVINMSTSPATISRGNNSPPIAVPFESDSCRTRPLKAAVPAVRAVKLRVARCTRPEEPPPVELPLTLTRPTLGVCIYCTIPGQSVPRVKDENVRWFVE